MRRLIPSCSDRGFALPAILLCLLCLSVLLAAGFSSARLELTAARSLAGSIRAFQGAEAGLALLGNGSWSGGESSLASGLRLSSRIDTLWRTTDSVLLLRARVRAEATDPAGRRIGRRTLEVIWMRTPDEADRPIKGTWREVIQLEP
jgi:Tfp pilus assembly protein PilX